MSDPDRRRLNPITGKPIEYEPECSYDPNFDDEEPEYDDQDFDDAPPSIELNAGQAAAVQEIEAWIAGRAPAISLRGAAGTGKTMLLSVLRNTLACHFSAILWTALTGKAAQRVRDMTGKPAMTLHKALYRPPGRDTQKIEFTSRNQLKNPAGVLLIVDEASMVTPKIWADLQIWMREGVRVLFVGDSFQLPPILSRQEQGGFDGDFSVFSLVKGPALTEVMRSGDDVLAAATVIRVENRLLMESRGTYDFRRGSLQAAVNEYLKDPEDHALITWRNRVRMVANRMIRQARGYDGVLPCGGEPILICRNGQDRLNGDILTVDRIQAGHLLGPIRTAWLTAREHTTNIHVSTMGKDEPMDGQVPFLEPNDWRSYCAARRRCVREKKNVMSGALSECALPDTHEIHDTRAFEFKHEPVCVPDPLPITWGYTLTAHKAQGSEFRRVTVFLPEEDTASRPFLAASRLPEGKTVQFWARWVYTALTRAKTRATIMIGGK